MVYRVIMPFRYSSGTRSHSTRILVLLSAITWVIAGEADGAKKQKRQEIELVSIECRKIKTKVLTLANQKGWRQSSKPIKTRSRHKARENVQARAGFGFTWLIGRKSGARTLNQSLSEVR